ncbi:MAG: ATP synthase subunit C [Spirochaetes bacterium]|nr:ATP synthase subunit C [Spirochaetota bacterium]
MDGALGLFGAILALGLGAVGSSIGCGIAGMTSHGAMSKTDEGHGLFLGLSAMPASQTIYGFVLMIILQGAAISGFAKFGIGFSAGLGLMTSAIYQGKACSSAILGVSKKASISGKVFLAPGIVESFALFSLVGGIVLSAAQ